MADSSALIVKLFGDVSGFDKSFRQANRLLGEFGDKATALGSRMSAAITLPIVGLGAAALQAAGKMEQTNIAFKTMLGNADAAQKHLQQLKEFAASTPFEFEDVVAASRKMQALGFSAQEVLPTLRTVGDAAAGLGLGAEGINRITLALGQMKAKGAVQAEEMRQLAEVGIPAWQILAKTLNTDVAGAMKLVEKRAVDSAQAVPALLAGINAKFGGLMAAQSQTLLGQWSNFKDKMFLTLVEIGNAMKPVAEDAVKLLTAMGEKAKVAAEGFAKLPDPIRKTAEAVAALVIVAGPITLILGQLATAIKAVREAWLLTAGIRTAMGVAAMSAGGIGVGVGAGLLGLWELAKGTKTYQENLAKLSAEQRSNALAVSMSTQEHSANSKALMDSVFSTTAAKKATEEHSAATIKVAEKVKDNSVALAKAEVAHQLLLGRLEKLPDASAKAAIQLGKQAIAAGILSYQLDVLATDSSRAALDLDLFALSLATGRVEARQADLTMDDYRGTIFETEAIMRAFGKTGQLALLATENATRQALERMIELYRAGAATAQQVQAIGELYAKAVKDRKTGGVDVADPGKAAAGVGRARQPLIQVSTIVTDLSRGITDVIFKAKTMGQVFTEVGKSIAQALVRSVIERGVNYAVKGLDKLLGSLGGVGNAVGKVFGSGATAAAGAAGSAGSSAASAGGAVGSGISGVVSAISGVVTAAASVVQAFQLHGIGKDTGRMEESLRGLLNVVALNGSESIHHFAKQSMFANVGVRDYWQGTGHALLVKISSNLDVITSRSAVSAGGITINIVGGVYGGNTAAMQQFADDLARVVKEKTGYRA